MSSQATPWVHEQISVCFLMFSHEEAKSQSILSVTPLQIQIKPKVISPEVINAVVPLIWTTESNSFPTLLISKHQTTCALMFLK